MNQVLSLTLVHFSLDANRSAWELATKADGISWLNISDGRGNSSPVKQLYNVQAIPASFLIAPDGIIIEQFDYFSDDRMEVLTQLCKRNRY